MTIRLLHIVSSLNYGGSLKQLLLLSTHLPPRQFEVRLLSLAGEGPMSAMFRRAGVLTLPVADRRHRIGRSLFGNLEASIRDFAPDIVHTWTRSANLGGRAAAIRARVPHLVASRRAIPHRSSFSEVTADRILTRWTGKYIVSSPQVRERCIERGLPAAKMAVIRNGVEPSRRQACMPRDELLARYDLPHGARLIGAIGPLRAEKRMKDLIWAADLLKVVRDDVFLLIVGDGPHAWRLRRFRDLVGIGDRVLFIGCSPDLPRWLPHLDCVWLGNQREALGNVLLESMSAGIPVIATDTSGNREAITHNESGFLVRVGDRAAIARLTQRVLENPQLAKSCGRAAQQVVQDRFGVQTMVEQYVHMYQQLMADQKPRNRQERIF